MIVVGSSVMSTGLASSETLPLGGSTVLNSARVTFDFQLLMEIWPRALRAGGLTNRPLLCSAKYVFDRIGRAARGQTSRHWERLDAQGKPCTEMIRIDRILKPSPKPLAG